MTDDPELNSVPVGIGELRATRDLSSVLVAYGLGSCVGVCVYDPRSRIGGLAHVMLPSSAEAANQAPSGKYADYAVPRLVEEVVRLGGDAGRLVGKIAGGAHMLDSSAYSNGFNVGQRNIEAVKRELERCGVNLLRADTGGNRGRTLFFHLRTTTVLLRTVGEQAKEL